MNERNTNQPALLKEPDAAKYVGLSLSTLRLYRRNGRNKSGVTGPPYFQPPGIRGVRYRISDLDKWLDANMRGAA